MREETSPEEPQPCREPLLGSRVALLNWRDRQHRLAGGAEEYATRVAHALAAAGAQVTFVAARDTGQATSGNTGPVRVVRRGGRWTVYPWALLWLIRRRHDIDIVVDCQNGIPFFSPLVARRGVPVVLVMHHVHDAQFGVHFPPWLAKLGALLEGPVARLVYRGCVTVAVSPSTVRAMRERLNWRGPVFVVPNGIDPPPQPTQANRTADPSLVCLGRLVTHKRVDKLIDVARELRRRRPGLRLHVIGGGPLEDELRARAADLAGTVTVHGYLDDKAKARLLTSSWCHVTLSDGEGWGLTVIEAAAYGLPTVCRCVDGLCDSVRHNETGWLMTPDDDPVEVLDQLLGKIADPAAASAVGRACGRWAGRFDWQASGDRFVTLLAGLRRGSPPKGWRPGQHEALVAEFTLPAGESLLKSPMVSAAVGATSGGTGEQRWLLAEQHVAGDLVTALLEAGATGISVRAADDAERLLGGAHDGERGQPAR